MLLLFAAEDEAADGSAKQMLCSLALVSVPGGQGWQELAGVGRYLLGGRHVSTV